MRRIGSMNNSASARKLLGYLHSESVDALIELDGQPDQDGPWSIWVRDEVDVADAKLAYRDFLKSPNQPKFNVPLADLPEPADQKVDQIRRRDRQQSNDQQSSERAKSVRRRAAAQALNQLDMPVTVACQQSIRCVIGIIIVSVVLSLATNFSKPIGNRVGTESLQQKVYRLSTFVDRQLYLDSQGDSFASVRRGEIWRFVTPMFLHGDEFHLAFNMLWVYFLGSVIERLHGSWFFALLVTLTQLGGMALQVGIPAEDWVPRSLQGSPFVVGASGAVYGLFGFLLTRPWVDDSYPINLVPINIALMMVMLVAGIAELIPNVANGAHLGGLIAGMILGAIPFFGRLCKSKTASDL